MTTKVDWKDFEKIVEKIHRITAPNAIVKHDQKIKGLSGINRQLDVTMSQKIGLHKLFIVIECKHHKRRVTITTVESFATMLSDVQANLGVIVSYGTFSEGARAQAKRHNIKLLSYREAQEFDWNSLVDENTWIKLTELEHKTLLVCLPPLSPPFSTLDADTSFSHGQLTFTLQDIISRFMSNEADKFYRRSADFSVKITTLEPLFVHLNDTSTEISYIHLSGKLLAKEYIIQPQFGGGEVLKDELTQQQMFRRLYTEDIDWGILLNSQRYVELTPEQYRQSPATPLMIIDPEILEHQIRVEFIQNLE